MINLSTFLLPSWIPMVLAFIAAYLIMKINGHSKYIRFMHFLGRFYIFFVYFLITFNLFGVDSSDIGNLQALGRGAVTLLMFEEIIAALIEKYLPTKIIE